MKIYENLPIHFITGALKFVLPVALGAATFACPILGGAAAVSSIVWEVEKILSSIKEIKESIERLEESDYKSAMQRFKEEVLIKLKNDMNPTIGEIQSLKEKAIDAFNKLADKKIEEKLELIKVYFSCDLNPPLKNGIFIHITVHSNLCNFCLFL